MGISLTASRKAEIERSIGTEELGSKLGECKSDTFKSQGVGMGRNH